MFDSNQMLELAHIKADRYQRAGGGGAYKVYNTSQAYWEARGLKHMSEFVRAITEAREVFRIESETMLEHLRMDCWQDIDGKGIYDDIPF